MTKHDGMEVESILINQTKIGQAPCQVWSGNVNLPIQLSLQPAYRRLEVVLDECDVGADRLQRARHNPLPLASPHRRKVAILCVPIRKVIVPITHDLVHAATVHCARQAARLVHEVTGERGTGWPNSHVVDVAVEGLVQSIHELCHATKPRSQVLQNRSWGILRGFLIDALAAGSWRAAAVEYTAAHGGRGVRARHASVPFRVSAGPDGADAGRDAQLSRPAKRPPLRTSKTLSRLG